MYKERQRFELRAGFVNVVFLHPYIHTIETILSRLTLTGYGRQQKYKRSRSEDTNVTSDPVLLVLCNALCYPGDIADFLCNGQPSDVI